MIKNVTINEVLTPAGQVATAEAILGKVIAPPKSRWNPGSLAQAALLGITAPCLVFLSPSLLTVVTCATEEQSDDAFSALVAAGAANLLFVGVPSPGGSQRSRGISLEGFGFEVGYTSGPDTLEPSDELDFVSYLIGPSSPIYSAASLLNKIDSYFQDAEVPADFFVLLNQFTGKLLIRGTPETASNLLHPLLLDSAGVSVLAAYSLAVPTPEDVGPSAPTGPIWG